MFEDFYFRFEWKPEDMWIGVFWKKNQLFRVVMWDMWICFVPCFPLHIRWFETLKD